MKPAEIALLLLFLFGNALGGVDVVFNKFLVGLRRHNIVSHHPFMA